MDKVLVTGANGHLGLHIVEALITRGYSVRASVRDVNNPSKTKELKRRGAEVVYADLLDRASLDKALQGCDGLFQVAAGFKVHTKDMMKDVWRPAIEGTENILRAAHKAGIKKVIYTSSVAAVGVTGDGVAKDENVWNDNAQELYAHSKNESEKLAWKLARTLSLNLVAVLPGTIIGPGFSEYTPSTYFFQKIAHNKLPMLPDLSFSFVDVRDVAAAHVAAYEQPSASGRYIVTRETVPTLKVYTIAHTAYERIKVPARRIPNFMLPLLPFIDWLESRFTGSMRTLTRGVVREYMSGKQQLFDTSRAARELAWAPRPIEDSIRDTLHWIYEH